MPNLARYLRSRSASLVDLRRFLDCAKRLTAQRTAEAHSGELQVNELLPLSLGMAKEHGLKSSGTILSAPPTKSMLPRPKNGLHSTKRHSATTSLRTGSLPSATSATTAVRMMLAQGDVNISQGAAALGYRQPPKNPALFRGSAN